MSDLDIPPPPEHIVVVRFVPWQTTMAQLHPILLRYDAEIIKLPIQDVNPISSPKGVPVRVSFSVVGWDKFCHDDPMRSRCLVL